MRKLIRTVQSEFSFLKDAKDSVYRHSRRLLSKPHETEFHALKFIPDSLRGSYVDIGANQGQSIESIKVIKPAARVYSFEANQLLACRLQARYRGRSDITVFSYGLSDDVQNRTLFVPVYRKFVYDGDASFDRMSAAALYNSDRFLWFSPKKLELKELSCSVQRLDDQNIDPLFMKLDVQGHELRVVNGGLETIKRYQPILMVEGLHHQPELSQLLSSLGYEEYVFDEAGFYHGRSSGAINQLLLTRRRAGEVILSPAQSYPRKLVTA
jgi:FkbM family methyltransferase